MSVPTEPGFYHFKPPTAQGLWTICEVDSEMNVWVIGSGNCMYPADMEGWKFGPRIPEYDPNAIPIEKFAELAHQVWLEGDNTSFQDDAIKLGLFTFDRCDDVVKCPGWPKLEGEGW